MFIKSGRRNIKWQRIIAHQRAAQTKIRILRMETNRVEMHQTGMHQTETRQTGMGLTKIRQEETQRTKMYLTETILVRTGMREVTNTRVLL